MHKRDGEISHTDDGMIRDVIVGKRTPWTPPRVRSMMEMPCTKGKHWETPGEGTAFGYSVGPS